MRVFLIGATGHIGRAVTRAVQRAGHHVIGLARSDEAEAALRALDVQPLRGDLEDLDALRRGAQHADAVITAGSASTSERRGQIEQAAVHAMLGVVRGTNKPFLYTSDQLIYGRTPDGQAATEDTPLDPPPFLSWRPQIEQDVLTAPGVRGLVIRPVAVYGDGGDHLTPILVGLARGHGAVPYVETGEARWSFIHRDDLADLYVRVLERAPAGTLVNASGDEPHSMRELSEAVASGLGMPGKTFSMNTEQALSAIGPFAGLFTHNLVASAAKAKQLLDWQPTQHTFTQELEQTAANR